MRTGTGRSSPASSVKDKEEEEVNLEVSMFDSRSVGIADGGTVSPERHPPIPGT